MITRLPTLFLSLLLGLATSLCASAQTLTLLSSTPIPNFGVLTAVSGTTVYVFCTVNNATPNLLVFDASNPAAPRLLSTTALPQLATLFPAYWAVSGTTLYVSTYAPVAGTRLPCKLLAIDITSPAAPAPGNVIDILTNTVYLAARPSGGPVYALHQGGQILTAYNSSLTAVGTTQVPIGDAVYPDDYNAQGLAAGDRAAYVEYNTTYTVVDLTTPNSPVSAKTMLPGSITAVVGSRAYGLQYAPQGAPNLNPLMVYDVSAPLTPKLTQTLQTQVGARLAAGLGGQSVFTVGAGGNAGYGGFYGANVRALYFGGTSTPTAQEDAGPPISGANALAANGNTGYVLTDNSLRIYSFTSGALATTSTITAAEATLYPNPAQGVIHLSHKTPGTTVTIYDLAGHLCLQAPLPADGSLDIHSLANGLYFVRTGANTSKLSVE